MPPRKKKVAAASVGLAADEVAAEKPPAAVKALAKQVADDGGAALATYRDPFGAHWLILAALPIDTVSPTPYQRELSDAHAKKLVAVIPKVERFLDPLIAIKAPNDGAGYWTPNGMHRLEAMKRLGAKSVTVLLVPEVEVAYRILALNTEKAHNLKDKSLEVVRMAHSLAEDPVAGKRPERDWAFEFEEPAYLTIGRCYESNARFSGGAYMPVVRRCEDFFDDAIADCENVRGERAERLLALDKQVGECVKALKEAGLQSTYLKPFVVARINPLRFVKTKRGETGPIAEFDETIDKMMAKAEKFDASKIKAQDLAKAGGMGGGE
jgi:ParB family chromosome partitioning protein